MWQTPPAPTNEAARLAALTACGIMDTPREERFDRLTWLAQRLYGADAAFIGFVDASHQWMKAVAGEGIPEATQRPTTICQSVVSTGEALVVGDLKTDPRFAGHPSVPLLTLRFYAGVPLMVAPDLVVGTFCIMREDPEDAATFDIAPLKALAAIVVDELELRSLNRELARLTRVDALTGLANRRAFDEELQRAAARCQRTSEPLSLLLLDLDRFKMLNDVAGHQAGDDALRRVGRALAACEIRQDDVICRYGGEEFAVILPGSDPDGAALVAERIGLEMDRAGIAHPVTGQLTTSIGIASAAGGRSIALDRLIADADAALYAAKRTGLGTIVRAGGTELPAESAVPG